MKYLSVLSLASVSLAFDLGAFLHPQQNVLSDDTFLLSSQFDQLTRQASDGYKYYTELTQQEIEQSDSKELLQNLDSLKDQFVIRFSNWNGLDPRNSILKNAKNLGLDIWEVSNAHKFIDVKCTKEEALELVQTVQQSCSNDDRYEVNLMIEDLPQAIFETLDVAETEELAEDDGEVEMTGGIFFKRYRRLDSIYKWFDILVETYPDVLSVEWIGQTFEGRDIKALRISGHKSNDEAIKTVVITGGIHAREWISISTVCYIISNLLSDYEKGKKKVTMYLDNLDFLFLPVMNPDGYDYSWKTERLWRKNRQETYHPRCFGLDIDHSFNFHFTKGDDSPCSEEYSGEGAFESLESYAWDNYLNQTRHRHPIYAYIDLHSYAEEVLYPYAYSCTEMPRDEENLLELAYGLSQAVRLRSGKVYSVLSACEDRGADLLPSMGAGSALDYMYHNKAYWAFVLKLRDSGSRGFLLPSKYIVPVGDEIYASVKYFADFLLNPDN
ncbi:DEKNAAC102291 [Brettanomyces naardenensis]|uniref:Inactive metallocarboxypeptidase ECM14 n=1 Tax=Brettanomyces naardenensis TaxID=13370 RepID=A0A448YLM2_BRENA|nr:DEKNAAC102291 [Brettanomyces naardenensis]